MGLTTAATTWLAAAIGLTVGAGYYAQAISATLAGLIVLLFFPSFEASFDRLRHIITYEVGCDPDLDIYKHIESVFTQNGLRLRLKKRSKGEGQMTIVWEAFGSPEAHDQVVQSLLQDERVHELTY
jgi:putative Mg2+ transporter-C (MgtC) family protein